MIPHTRPRTRMRTVAFFLVAACTVVGAQNNYQKTYPLDSPEYEAIRSLYIEQGIALPFSTGPFPQAELRAALDRIDAGELSSAGRRTFNWVTGRFVSKPGYTEADGRFRFALDPEFTIESYLHTDSDNPLWEYRPEERRPFARFPFEFWAGNHAYAVFDLDFQKNIPDFSLYPTYSKSDTIDLSTEEEDPVTNLPINVNTLDVQFPHRAFLSVGGDHWNAQIGRDIIDWGNGRTGNLYISDYADWHDALQFSSFWDRFKFSWIWVSLNGHLIDREREHRRTTVGYDTDGDGEVDQFDEPASGDPGDVVYSYDADEEHKNLIAQRWEIRLWDRLGLAYTEGIVFGREQVELRHLNPLYHYHNLYTNTQNVGNSHRSFEFDVALTTGLNLYAALTPDQWSSPLEPGTDLTEEPNAIAYLAGLDYRRPVGDGYLHATVEGVYSSAWMYIHNSPLTSTTNRRFVMAQHGEERTQVWIDRPLGHYGGNDYALIWLDASYGEVGRFRYGATTYYEGDGSVPINALLESTVTDGLRGELTEEQARLQAPSDGYEGRETQWRTVFSVYGEIWPWFIEGFNDVPGAPGGGPTHAGAGSPRRTLRLSSELSLQRTRNRLHESAGPQVDLQWVLSATIGL